LIYAKDEEGITRVKSNRYLSKTDFHILNFSIMSTIKQGISGGFSGKTGTVIGSSWKGIAVMRGIAPSIAQPNTEASSHNGPGFQ